MRPRAHVITSLLATLLVGLLVVVPATLGAKRKEPGPKPPAITAVKPSKLVIGQTLTISGSGFRPGALANTVVFSRKGAISVFAKADSASSTRLTVVVPAKLAPFLTQRDGKSVATRFQLRILSKRLSRSATRSRLSPIIGPAVAGGSGGTTPPPINDCDRDAIANEKEVDDDNDLLSDDREKGLKTDPCNPDSDGDSVEDGYEVEAALDLNSRALPYAGKRPYPNALDPKDGGVDYDGDTLTSFEEYSAWVRYGGHVLPLTYSDGCRRTSRSSNGCDPGGQPDDLRDVDNDGLNNYTEAHGSLTGQDWWTKFFDGEKAYRTTLPGTDWLDPDTDGDGRLDGADDQDYDGYDNAFEVAYNRSQYWVQPFNPCLPDPSVDMCSRYIDDPKDPWPPFFAYDWDDQGPLPPPAPDTSGT